MSSPMNVWITSSPPMPGSSEPTTSRSAGSPSSATQSSNPLSPSTRSPPAPVSMSSFAAPPMTMSPPLHGHDPVVAADRRRDRRDDAEGHRDAAELRRIRRRCGDPGAVADHQVAAAPGVDAVGAGAGDHDVVAVGREDRVGAAEARVQRLDDVQIGGIAVERDPVQRAVVAEHQVVAGVRLDQRSPPCRRARCPARCRSGSCPPAPSAAAIVAARPSVIGTPPNCGAFAVAAADRRVVAEHEVAAFARVDVVVVGAGDDDVVAAAREDRVDAAERSGPAR